MEKIPKLQLFPYNKKIPKGKNYKIVIMGLGLHGGGVSSACFFARLGCYVLVTDLKKENDLKASLQKLKKFKKMTFALGRHRKNDFKKADLIIRNPAVPNDSEFLAIARQHNIPVHTDVSWFLKFLQATNYKLQAKIIGITGTKGKSTTAALLHHVLTKCGKKAILAGNIKKSPLDFLKNPNYKLTITNYIVLELSSWHLESLAEHKLAPDIALITNIFPDHLNRYKSFRDYKQVKTFIFKHQSNNDILFLNKDDRVSRQICKSKKIKPKIIWYGEKDAILAVCNYLNLNKKNVQSALKTFSGLEGRLELVANINNIKYYNDTCATQPEATIYAIKNIKCQISNVKSNIILIAGGEDKNLHYDQLAKTIVKNIKTLILLKGSASTKIIKALKKYPNIPISQYPNINSMKQAVSIAKKYANPNDIVLLSPAAASFNLFKHEFDRGAQFKKEVKANIKICHKKHITPTTS